MASEPSGSGRPAPSGAYRQRWRLGFGALTWRTEDRAYAGLLEALTRERELVLRQTQELDAPAAPLPKRGINADLERGARAELAVFRAAVEDARTRGSPDGLAEVAYDSRSPDQDTWADILIQYLVRLGYADVRTEELEPWHYLYSIRIHWERLRQLARDEGHALPD
jgi:hypothetical protein